ncbi:MAG: HAMP domain-containing histidine kinase [Chloroflexi bacterium]|nr:HAMP domain-containing histidine kinase [Chloroflexota bacterium]
MSLRARLLASLAIMLAVALLGAGILLVGLTRAALIDRVDAELESISSAATLVQRMTDLTEADDVAGRRLAILRLDKRGNVNRAFPSGFADDPDPIPVLPSYPDGFPASALGPIVERPAADGSLRYHVRTVQGRGGAIVAIAAPLAGVDAAVGALGRTLLLVGAIAMGALLVVGWAVLRRGLVPIERIANTAEAITEGDLSQRTGVPHDGTEVGRLGAAFDAMLDQIEDAFAEQRRALDAKAHSEDRLRRFVADASHELRTPLTAVRGYADLYRAGGLAAPAELDAAMGRIGTESRRMGVLVDDLLLLARLDQGRALRRDPVDLSRVCAEAVTDARAVEPGRPIVGAIEPEILVIGDEDGLRQVIGNLLANVRVHTPATTPLEMILRRDGDRAELRVVDHGPGIDPEHAPRVFDRFFRADPGRSRERGGSGLGLSIVASIVDAHGGGLWHEATPGGGATFGAWLPFTAGSQPDPGRSPAPPPTL